MKKYVFLAFLLSLCLNIYGIWWAGPSDERIILVFSDHSMVDRLSPAMLQSRDDIYQGIEYYDQPQDYRDYDISIDGHNTQTVRRSLLDSARSYLLRSYAPDEHATLKAIGNMNPSRFDFNPGFFLYGGLYIYTVSIFLKLMSIAGVVKTIPDISYYFMNPGQMGLLFTYGKLISALFVSAAVFFVYLCGELLFGRRAGLIAAFLFAVTPAVVVWSHYLNPHAFTLFWMMLSLFTVLRLYRSRKINDYIKSGFTAGLAAGSLLTYGFVILALPIVQFTINVKDGFRKAAASVLSKNMWIALVACIAGFLLVNPFWLFSLKQVVMEFNAASIHWRFAPTPGNLFYHFRHVIMAGLGFPLWLTSIFGFVAAVAGRRKEVLLLVILFLPALIYFSFSTTRFMHYGLFMYPLLILLAAGFLERLIAGKKLMRIAGLTVLLAVFSYTFAYSVSLDVAAGRKNTKTLAGEWINENIPQGASVGLLDVPSPWRTPPFEFFKYEIINTRWDKTLLEDARPEYFVAAEYQWLRGRSFAQLEEYLQDYREIQRFEEYPGIPGFSFRRDGNSPWDWADINPEIVVFKKRGSG